MDKALPLILCGRHASISKAASEALKPQFKESAKEDIPRLLHHSEGITGVVLGGGFDQKSFDQIRASVWKYKREAAPEKSLHTTWLRNDLKTKYHNNPLLPGKQELYGQEVGERAKKQLLALLKSGHLQPPTDKVYFF